jgi:hypothetical protein
MLKVDGRTVDNAGNETEDCQQDVDEKVSSASLEMVLLL